MHAALRWLAKARGTRRYPTKKKGGIVFEEESAHGECEPNLTSSFNENNTVSKMPMFKSNFMSTKVKEEEYKEYSGHDYMH